MYIEGPARPPQDEKIGLFAELVTAAIYIGGFLWLGAKLLKLL
jgi:hypothetical protein